MKKKMHAGAERLLYQRARELRNRETGAEEVLWGYLKTKPSGYKFRRQHPYSIYILGFYCHRLQLIIEIDGSIHDLEEVKQNDIQREEILKASGLTIMRFTNVEVLTNLEQVISQITLFANQRNNEL